MGHHFKDFPNNKFRLMVINQLSRKACFSQLLVENRDLFVRQINLATAFNIHPIRHLENIPSHCLAVILPINTRNISFALSGQFGSLIIGSNNHEDISDMLFVVCKNHLFLQKFF